MNNTYIAQELVAVAKELTAESRAKYVVNFHDGVKVHRDGSPFYDSTIQQ